MWFSSVRNHCIHFDAEPGTGNRNQKVLKTGTDFGSARFLHVERKQGTLVPGRGTAQNRPEPEGFRLGSELQAQNQALLRPGNREQGTGTAWFPNGRTNPVPTHLPTQTRTTVLPETSGSFPLVPNRQVPGPNLGSVLPTCAGVSVGDACACLLLAARFVPGTSVPALARSC